MLVVFRNPKDTLVSFYHFCNNNPVLPRAESWDSFYSDFMKGDGESNTADVSNTSASGRVAAVDIPHQAKIIFAGFAAQQRKHSVFLSLVSDTVTATSWDVVTPFGHYGKFGSHPELA